MEKKQVTAEVPERKNAKGEIVQAKLGPVTAEVNMPESFEEAKKLGMEEAVLTNAFANWRVTLQGNIRSALKRGEKPADIQARLASAQMGVAQTGGKVDAEQAFMAKFASATPKEREAMIAKLKAAAQG